MFVSFLSIDQEMNKTKFQSEATLNANEILFEDKSCLDTKIKLTILENSLILERFGFIDMRMQFCLDKHTYGTYKNKDGLEFDFEVFTKRLEINRTKIKVSYDMLVNKEVLSTLFFQVVLFQN